MTTRFDRVFGWDRSRGVPGWFPVALWLALGASVLSAQPKTALVRPLDRAHAHNDYLHSRPLLDALDRGFCSVEADVFLVDGKLLVAHERFRTSTERTLQALYLDPLAAKARANGGRVHRGGPTCLLLVDLKSEAETTYAALHQVLEAYKPMLTSFHHDGRVTTNAVTVIVSGNRPRQTMAGQQVRYAALDGRAEDLDTGAPVALIPLISDNWTKHFRWRGRGDLPAEDAVKLKAMVARAHEQGRWLRLWAAPDESRAWSVLHSAGVDLINTDDLDGLKSFLLSLEKGA